MAPKKKPAASVAVEDAKAWMAFAAGYAGRRSVDALAELELIDAKLERQIGAKHPKAKQYSARRSELAAARRGAEAMEG